MALSEAQEQVLRMRASGMTRKKIADELGISLDAVKDRLRRAKQWQSVTPGQATAMEVSGLDVTNARHGWRVVQHGDGSRDSVFWKAEAAEEENLFIETMREALAEYRGTFAPQVSPCDTNDDSLTIYPLIDWHVGLLAWAEETGENYDLSIARDTILNSMARLIAATPPSKQCVVLGLGDLLHFDGYEPTTSRSKNFLDADGRYPKVLKTAVQMVIATIDMALRRHDTVLVRILAGNHDDQSAVAVGLALSLYYDGHARVTVDDSPSRFWWYRFGKVLLGATHGDKAKMRDLPLVMAHDRPNDWAASSYRRMFTGHLHNERKIEEGGVIVTCMRTPVAKDAWHSFERYRSGRSVYSETFRADGTEAATLQFNL